jgi:hypothetical protein
MNKYKYQISDKTDQEIWVCEVCKKGKNQLILTGKWKLIDRCSDSGIPCEICKRNNIDTESSSSVAKKET